MRLVPGPPGVELGCHSYCCDFGKVFLKTFLAFNPPRVSIYEKLSKKSNCLNSTSWIVFMNRNSGRIRALSWYLMTTFQSHNNKNDLLTRPREVPGLSA